MKTLNFGDEDIPEWFASPVRHKNRFFIKRNPKDRWEDKLRVKYIGEDKAIADVWGWDQDAHEFTYINEISVMTEWLHTKYKQLTDPNEIQRKFTDQFKKLG